MWGAFLCGIIRTADEPTCDSIWTFFWVETGRSVRLPLSDVQEDHCDILSMCDCNAVPSPGLFGGANCLSNKK